MHKADAETVQAQSSGATEPVEFLDVMRGVIKPAADVAETLHTCMDSLQHLERYVWRYVSFDCRIVGGRWGRPIHITYTPHYGFASAGAGVVTPHQ